MSFRERDVLGRGDGGAIRGPWPPGVCDPVGREIKLFTEITIHHSEGKESTCNAGDPGSIPGSERSSGKGNGYPLPYSCVENSVDRGAWRAKSLGSQRIEPLTHITIS